MHDRDNVWICIADLLAGIMAFFVFVSAGIYADYLGMEGLVYGAGVMTTDPQRTIYGDAHQFSHEVFERNKYTLKSEGRTKLEKVAGDIGNFVKNGDRDWKILVIGHASCSSSLTEEDMQGAPVYDANGTKTTFEKLDLPSRHKEMYKASNWHNTKLSIDRAYAVFSVLWLNSDIEANGIDNIRYIGMSESQAAARQGDIVCNDRNSGKRDDEQAQAVEIFVVEEWPSPLKFEQIDINSTATKPATRFLPPLPAQLRGM